MSEPFCDTFWGTHGCDLPPGHDGAHECRDGDEPHSRHDGQQRWDFGWDWDDNPLGWGDPMPSTTFSLDKSAVRNAAS